MDLYRKIFNYHAHKYMLHYYYPCYSIQCFYFSEDQELGWTCVSGVYGDVEFVVWYVVWSLWCNGVCGMVSGIYNEWYGVCNLLDIIIATSMQITNS